MNNITVHHSNRLEVLADRLGTIINKKRKSDFTLEPDVVLINNYEMAQWLSIRIAEAHGICANISFRLFGSFAWSLARNIVTHQEDTDVIDSEQLKWITFRVLQDIEKSDRIFNDITNYLEAHPYGGIYHLATQLADMFDRYLNYRFEMLERWSNGTEDPEDGWQPRFWRQLLSIAQGKFRADWLRDFLTSLQNRLSDEHIPKNIYLFGVSYLPPLHIETLFALSNNSNIDIFILNPCRHYWLDTVSRKTALKLKKINDPDDIDNFFPEGNRLLSSFGYSGRSFLTSLYSYEPGEGKDFFLSCREDNNKDTLLAMIQDDILDLKDSDTVEHGRRYISPTDDSLKIASCHSPLREVEVLHDHLVAILEQDPHLHPHDILVMAPDIERYACFIDAVFRTAPQERFIPFTVADRRS
jgi:exodeoxyribonuclease V gamma subunit